MRNRRRFYNYIVDPRLQIGFAGYTIMIAAAFSASIVVFSFIFLQGMLDSVTEAGEVSSLTQFYLEQAVHSYLSWLVIILLVFMGVLLTYMTLSTHRIAGATYAISKHVKTHLLGGDYTQRIHLRKHDYLDRLADDLNRLSDQLEQQGGQTTRGTTEVTAIGPRLAQRASS